MAGESVAATRMAAENAVLHCLLPILDADHFVAALEALGKADLTAGPPDASSIGGILKARVARLHEIVTASGLGIAESVDYWTALS